MKLESVLRDYGLSEKQAKIYLACLELGSASVQKISKKSGVARSTAYEILEDLEKLALVSKFQREKITNYNAESPRQLIHMISSRLETLKDALPQFDAIYGDARVRPTVRFFQGKEGMKLILEEILDDDPKEIRSFSSADDLFVTLEKEFPNFVKMRIKKKILAKVILRDTSKAKERAQLGPQELREVRILPAHYEFHATKFIWSKKIAILAYPSDLVSLIVESEHITNMEREIFDIIWEQLQ